MQYNTHLIQRHQCELDDSFIQVHRTLKSTPAVLIIVGANLSSEKRVIRLVFPTPESPRRRMRIVWSKSSP